MKKIFVFVLFFILTLSIANIAQAKKGCYICKNGNYVQFMGDDSESKRREAGMCGCKVMGTMSPCSIKAKKILCTVKLDQDVRNRMVQVIHPDDVKKADTPRQATNEPLQTTHP